MIIEPQNASIEDLKVLHGSLLREYDALSKTEGWQRFMVYLDSEIAAAESSMRTAPNEFLQTKAVTAFHTLKNIRWLSANQAEASRKRLEQIQKEEGLRYQDSKTKNRRQIP